MMMNLQTLALLFVVQIVSIWKKAQMNPHQLSLEATCGPFCSWNLQNLAQVISTLKKAWVDPHQLNLEVTYLTFCNQNHQDHFLIWLPPTSLECQRVGHQQSPDCPDSDSDQRTHRGCHPEVQSSWMMSPSSSSWNSE